MIAVLICEVSIGYEGDIVRSVLIVFRVLLSNIFRFKAGTFSPLQAQEGAFSELFFLAEKWLFAISVSPLLKLFKYCISI